MTIARDFGYSVNEGMIARDMLYTADEVFLTGSAAEVNAITSVDRRTIGSGMIGPVTAELRAAFIRTIRGKRDPFRGMVRLYIGKASQPTVAGY